MKGWEPSRSRHGKSRLHELTHRRGSSAQRPVPGKAPPMFTIIQVTRVKSSGTQDDILSNPDASETSQEGMEPILSKAHESGFPQPWHTGVPLFKPPT